MELIENYQKALKAIYEHVGFKEDWVVCPIDDRTDSYWSEDGENVMWADSVKEFENEKGNFYKDEIYKQRFYEKWVYQGEKFTMIFCNPRTDNMKWFRLFDNNKRLPCNAY